MNRRGRRLTRTMNKSTAATLRTFRPLTDDEAEALRAFAREHGPAWKQRLAALWQRAAAIPVLHCLRNDLGHDWLDGFAMVQPARVVVGGRVVVERGSTALRLRKGDRLEVADVQRGVVTLAGEAFGAPIVAFEADDCAAMVTTLRHPRGVIAVRALGCEAPRDRR